MDGLKEAFVEMVVQERGAKLKVSREELAEGRVYSGMEAVRLGLADEIGSDVHAFEKAAELAGVSDYEIVNINVEVNRLLGAEPAPHLFVQRGRRGRPVRRRHGIAAAPGPAPN